MTSHVHVHLLPKLFEPESLQGGVAVVIDVLRASTTIIHALAAQAPRVIPCGEIEIARSVAQELPPGTALLGGERHGERITGFDLDNSPLKYVPEVMSGKTLVFTTTNGTRALERCRRSARVVVGAFVNRRAIVETLVADGRPVHLICAGTDGYITAEDVLFAGSIADAVRTRRADQSNPDDETQLALSLWQTASEDPAKIRQCLRDSRGGLNLLELGFDHDIDRSATCDMFDLVPEYDLATNVITAH
ncbi:MAG: 2-phosphosulfolactate phosphatase [Planctomycetaceae bacterium]|nr:2-phosphosulfolactate phosphatase [Planctomycetaceae bacterium]